MTDALLLLNLQWPSSTDKAWISLRRLEEANVRRKAVFQVRCWREAWSRGSYGALVRDHRTQERSHLGVRDRETGLFNSIARMSSEIEGSAQTLDDLKAKV